MKFSDNSGHLFNVKDYVNIPVGYKYEVSKYVFWMNSEYSTKLSVGNWYCMPIRILLENDETIESINLESDVFKFKTTDLWDIRIDEDLDIMNPYVQTIENIYIKNDIRPYKLSTFYVFGKSSDEGTILSNILIKSSKGKYCIITVGGVFVDENEILVINGKNTGVSLPKDILKAIYSVSYNNESIDHNLYNLKLKEYLLNQMTIKGECGNYKSAKASLEWFGWGKYIQLSKLLRTDNEFIEQYASDAFNIDNDTQKSYIRFHNTSLLSLSVFSNQILDEYNKQNFYDGINGKFVGEGVHKLESLFDKTINIQKSDDYDVEFIRPWYDYTITEMLNKLACLSYMYNKYFLPVHIKIHSASVKEITISNPIKLLNKSSVSLVENPIDISDFRTNIYTTLHFNSDPSVGFGSYNASIVNTNNSVYNDELNELGQIHESISGKLAIKIPIQLKSIDSKTLEQINTKNYYNIKGFLRKADNDTEIVDTFELVTSSNNVDYYIVPENLKIHNKEYWINGTFVLDVICNSVWHRYTFNILPPDFSIQLGKLEYVYDYENMRQIKSMHNATVSDIPIEFNAHMFEPAFAILNDVDFNDDLNNILNNLSDAQLDEYVAKKLENYNIPIKPNVKNTISIYNIYLEGREIFSKNSEDINIYNMFFNNDGTQQINELTNYDFYLMDNGNVYYGVFISKLPESDFDSVTIPESIVFNDNIILKHYKTSSMVLISRLKPVWSDGNNIFNSKDIVCCRLLNSESPVSLHTSCKWLITNASLNNDMGNIFVTSNTEACIISMPDGYLEYPSGYYNISVNYTVDGNWNNTKSAKNCFLIK